MNKAEWEEAIWLWFMAGEPLGLSFDEATDAMLRMSAAATFIDGRRPSEAVRVWLAEYSECRRAHRAGRAVRDKGKAVAAALPGIGGKWRKFNRPEDAER
jgi:hypothetical protein